MNIIQILPQLELGGVERGTIDYALYLKEKGHRCVVVSGGGRLVSDLEKAGIKHYELPVHKKNIFTLFFCINQLKKIIRTEKAHIVHCRSRIPDLIGYWATLKSDAKLLLTAHGCYSYHLISRIVCYSKFLIVPSKSAATYFSGTFSVEKNKIIVISRGLDISGYVSYPAEDKFRELSVVFLGRLSPIKGVEYLIDAFDNIIKDYPDALCFIAGKAGDKHRSYEKLLKEKAFKMGLQDKIFFCGVKNPKKFLKDKTVLVMPSLVPETFGRVLIEAQACGTAAVATELGAAPEIIEDNVTGMLVPAKDSLSIAQAIKKYFHDRDFYTQITERARKKVEQCYTLDMMCDETLKVSQKLLDDFSIVVFKLASLGDVVLSSSTFIALRKRFPEAVITAVVGRRFFKVLSSMNCIDDIVIFEESEPAHSEILRISKILARRCYDLSVDLQNNHTSQLLSFLSFSKKSVGVARKLGFLNDIKINYSRLKHLSPISSQNEILLPLGIKHMPPACIAPDPDLVSGFKKNPWYCSGRGPLIGVNLGASAKWKTKTPCFEFYKNYLENALTGLNATILLVGTSEYSAKAERLCHAATDPGIINYCGRTEIHELTALIALCDVFITPDSAPLHIAMALNIPVIAIFGPTLPSRHVTAGPEQTVQIYTEKESCLGCYRKTCRTGYTCMNIDHEKILNLTRHCLEGRRT